MAIKKYTPKPKDCFFCLKGIKVIDYKDQTLERFLSPWMKIKPTAETGLCAKHQRKLAQAIKRARYLAILPYVRGQR